MTRDEIIRLKNLINKSKTTNYKIIEQITNGNVITDFHVWANGKKYEGAFLISNQDKDKVQLYWFVLIQWRKNDYYLVLYPKERNVPLIEIYKLVSNDACNEHLVWRYKPTKRDKKNKERVKCFKKIYNNSIITISFPKNVNEITCFYEKIFSLLDNRIKSDKLIDMQL